MQIQNYICGYTKDSFCDCPGFITPVLYVRGCNFRCNFCHNKAFSYENPDQYPTFDWDIINDDIKSKVGWYDAMVISGGEVTIIPNIEEKLSELKEVFGLPIKIDTNGSKPEVLASLMDNNIVSWAAIDVKHIWDKYEEITGVSNINIESCFNAIFDIAFRHYGKITFRTTLIPEISQFHKEMIRDQIPEVFELSFQKYIERN